MILAVPSTTIELCEKVHVEAVICAAPVTAQEEFEKIVSAVVIVPP